MGWPKEAYLYLRQIATPKSLPQTGGNYLYAKDDNALYLMDSDGTETAVNGGGGAGGGRQVLVYSSGSYPTRPVGGLCEYVGPTEPTDWVANDTWILA